MSLYPPIIDYSMPTFDYKATSVRIYFALSPFMRMADIKQAHLTVRYQTNNANALSSTYTARIKATNIYEVTPAEDPAIAATTKRYYVLLNASDLIKGKFEQGVIYKVQLRLSKELMPTAPKVNELTLGLSSFSEWSTVCLIKPIELPDFQIIDLISQESLQGQAAVTSVIFSSLTTVFFGKYIGGEDNQRLLKYQIQLWNEAKTNKIADSGEIIFTGYNYLPTELKNIVGFSIDLKKQMDNNTNYVLVALLTTKNGYHFERNFAFTAVQYSADLFPGIVTAKSIDEEGYIDVILEGDEVVSTNITIRRTSSESNFETWEDIANLIIVKDRVNIHYQDLTAQSGVFYRYGAQVRDNRGRRGILAYSNVVMGEWEDAFLVARSGMEDFSKQLKIRYDFNISNGMINVAESKTDTLGSQFPFVRRNGQMYYKTYQISGLITMFMDQKARMFVSNDEIYNNERVRYNNTLGDRQIHVHPYDYITEKRFRDLVFDYLYDDQIKLFKSNQEGNLLVKLMNISFNPVQSLDRMIYNFTATMVEVDEVNIENLVKYGIINRGEWSSNITFSEWKLGYLTSWTNLPDQNNPPIYRPFNGGSNIIDNIKKKEGYQQSDGSVIVTDFNITDLRIEVESPPYMIYDDGDNTRAVDNIRGLDQNKLVMGWLFTINGEKVILISPHNVYELRDDDIIITAQWTIIPAKDALMNISYKIALSQQVDYSRIASIIQYKDVVGQIRGHFELTENIFNEIKYRYYLDLPEYYQTLSTLRAIEVDAEPGTVFFGRTRGRDESKWVVGETGILFIHPLIENEYITDFYIRGIRINTNYVEPTDVSGTAGAAVFKSLHDKGSTKPTAPVTYDYYTESGKTYIWYKGDWYEAELDGDCIEIHCSADAMIDYWGQVTKGIY